MIIFYSTDMNEIKTFYNHIISMHSDKTSLSVTREAIHTHFTVADPANDEKHTKHTASMAGINNHDHKKHNKLN